MSLLNSLNESESTEFTNSKDGMKVKFSDSLECCHNWGPADQLTDKLLEMLEWLFPINKVQYPLVLQPKPKAKGKG